jgi:hypothetical protein
MRDLHHRGRGFWGQWDSRGISTQPGLEAAIALTKGRVRSRRAKSLTKIPSGRLASNRARWFLRRGAAPRRSSPASAVRSVGSGWSSRGRSGCVSAGVFAPTPTGPADPTRSSSMRIRFHWFAEICRKPVGTFRDKPNGFSPITSLVSAADHRASNAPTVRRQHTPTNHVTIVVVVATKSVRIPVAAIVTAET